MKYKKYTMFIVLCVILVGLCVHAQNFVVNKKNPQKQSMNKLKEQYADELADSIKLISGLQKQLASLQEQLIDELYCLLDDDICATKKELDRRISCANDLKIYLENELHCSLPSKSSFVKSTVNVSQKCTIDSKSTSTH